MGENKDGGPHVAGSGYFKKAPVKCEILDENNKPTGEYIHIPEEVIQKAMKGWKFVQMEAE